MKRIFYLFSVLGLLLPLLNGCNKDYLEMEDIQYSLSFPDTV